MSFQIGLARKKSRKTSFFSKMLKKLEKKREKKPKTKNVQKRFIELFFFLENKSVALIRACRAWQQSSPAIRQNFKNLLSWFPNYMGTAKQRFSENFQLSKISVHSLHKSMKEFKHEKFEFLLYFHIQKTMSPLDSNYRTFQDLGLVWTMSWSSF